MIDKFIPLASPDIRDEDIMSAVEVLKSGNLVQGVKVAELEQKISSYINSNYCVAVTNGTSTLHLGLIALGIGPGDEVIMPAFSYIATANVVELVGAKPIFIDINLNTFNIDFDLIEPLINPKTKAVMVVHEFGLPADIEKIRDICLKYNLFFIEDAACAIGAKENDVFAGTAGIFGSFSFHPRKAITSGEGGMVITKDIEICTRIKALRNHGLDPGVIGKMDFVIPGFNCRMTDIQAALLISQIDRLEQNIKIKSEIASTYSTYLDQDKFKIPELPIFKRHSWQTYHIILRDDFDQKSTILKLKEKNIGVNLGAQCMPEQTYFKKKYEIDSSKKFPMSMKAYTQGLAIPIYEKLSEESVYYIIDTLNNLK